MPRTEEAFKQMRDERRNQILDIATEVFTRKGLAGTKISDIAEEAHISQGLLYRYFSNKEKAFAAVIERATQGTAAISKTALEHSGSPWDKLSWLTEQLLNGVSQHPTYYQLFSQAFSIPGRIQEISEDIEPIMRAIQRLIEDGQVAGLIVEGDSEQLALLYLCYFQGLADGMMLYRERLAAHFPDAKIFLHWLEPN
jgi:AcrR family transcriptional regulator